MTAASSRLRRPASGRLVIKRRHAVKLAGFAKLLGVEPQRFLDWQMDDLIEELGEVDGGCSVVNWAYDGLLVFDDAKEEARVKARVLRWQSAQRAKEKEVEP